MHRNQTRISAPGLAVIGLVMITAIALKWGFVVNPAWYTLLYFSLPALLILIVRNRMQKKTTRKG